MRDTIWEIPYSQPLPPPELAAAKLNPLLTAVLSVRGVRTAEAARELLESNAGSLHDPMQIKDMPAATERIRRAIEARETVAVYGDYDVDGITATALLTDYLTGKGVTTVPYIPNRLDEGYGLNTEALGKLKDKNVSLVISVDCGITAIEEAEAARELGLDLVITDHHECKGSELPRAVAVVDCKRPGDEYTNKYLAGVGVALKLACACSPEEHDAIVERYADLVAIGTIADVVPLADENRFLVRKGLEKLRRSPRCGIAAMLAASGIDGSAVNSSSIGFSLAPRLNAAGRLGHAGQAVSLLLSSSDELAGVMAEELCELNRQRQSVEMDIWNDALTHIVPAAEPAPVVLASSEWHQGVIGIVASKLSEQFSVPSVMICLNGDTGKGSCRSYGDFNLFQALSACSEHLLSFGGHALAAGLTIRADKINDFRAALTSYYNSHRPKAVPDVKCDLLITEPGILTVDNVRSLDLLEPYGNANPKPVLCISGAELTAVSSVGKGKHLKLRIRLRGMSLEGIFFSHSSEELGLHVGELVDVAFTPQINEWNGSVSVQLLVSGLRRHESLPLCREILSGSSSVLRAAAPFAPTRSDFVYIWRNVCRRGFCVPRNAEAVLATCPPGFEAERYCICLMVFKEAGLLSSGNGKIFGARCVRIQGKADLEDTRIMRALNAFNR